MAGDGAELGRQRADIARERTADQGQRRVESDPPGRHDQPRLDGPASVEQLTALQRTAGNRAAGQWLAQRAATAAAAPAAQGPADAVAGALAGSGQALDDETRSRMEAMFGVDFSDVRLHHNPASARAMGAVAYTVGSDIVLGAPPSDELLGHELTHVVQQRAGAVAGSPTGDGLMVSSPDDAFERQAEAAGRAVQRQLDTAEQTG